MSASYEEMVKKIDSQLQRYSVTRKPKDWPSTADIMASKREGYRRLLDARIRAMP